MLRSRHQIRRKTLKRNDSSRDKHTDNHQNENWWLPAFFVIPTKRECISTHKVRVQLGIEDDILMGLGMCLQQAKYAHIRMRELLANLRSNNDCGLSAPLFKEKENKMEDKVIADFRKKQI